ncbi:MAG: flippase-like domain-containing protein [bacterium]|nr:flippase-like domain-containing protein [bacterium]
MALKKNLVRWSAIVGVLIFAFLIYKIGLFEIWENVKKLTLTNFLILMGLRLLYWTIRTINWKVILDEYGEKLSLFHLFTARIGSHAISQLTPSAQVGGEAARIFMINSSSKKISLASVVVDKTIEFLTVIAFTIIGVTIAITRLALPVKLKTIFVAVVVVTTLLLLFILSKQKKGLLGWIMDLLAKMKIKPKFLEKNRESIKETDEYISEFYSKHRWGFVKVIALYSLQILFWATEIHLSLVFIGADDITFMDSFLITVLGNLAFIFPLIPGSLGIYEATYIALFAILGKGTGYGFTLVLIRRILALLWAGIGLLGMLKTGKEGKSKTKLKDREF